MVMEHLIDAVMSPEMCKYDQVRWGEYPLAWLDGDNSHISYLSHLAWMIGEYQSIAGMSKYDKLYSDVCEAMNRRILASPTLNLPTYPGEDIYVPDMVVAIVALSQYAHSHSSTYQRTVRKWLEKMGNEYLDPETGMIQSYIISDENKGLYQKIRNQTTSGSRFILIVDILLPDHD